MLTNVALNGRFQHVNLAALRDLSSAVPASYICRTTRWMKVFAQYFTVMPSCITYQVRLNISGHGRNFRVGQALAIHAWFHPIDRPAGTVD